MNIFSLVLSKRCAIPLTMPNPTSYKVLLVDDSPPMLEALQYLLHDESDLKVIGVAETGQQAINLMIQNQPDVVLLDIHLPDLEGYEVTRLAKSLTPPPSLSSSRQMATRKPASAAWKREVMGSSKKGPIGLTSSDKFGRF